jgi:hypothetical protein
MGGIFSYLFDDTVTTIWRKHEKHIEKTVQQSADIFKRRYCTVSPEAFCGDYKVLITAFDEYVRTLLPDPYWEAYMYHHSYYSKYKLAFSEFEVKRNGICVGINLVKWPHNKY